MSPPRSSACDARAGERSLEDIINDALPRLARYADRAEAAKAVPHAGYDMGPSLVNIDNIAEAIAHAEGEDYK